MRVPLGFKGKIRTAVCDHVKRPSPRTLAAWRRHISPKSSAREVDSLELLESAHSKWHLYRARRRTVSSEGELLKLIENEPLVDALGMIAIQAPWARLDGHLGVCQFRRTWCHNFAIDYLAIHPVALAEPKTISGVGTALLFGAASLASQIDAKNIWLETTDLSVHFYSHLFNTDETSDIVSIPVLRFYETLRKRVGAAP
jgi:hypothetical protein